MASEEDWKSSKFRIFIIAVGIFLITFLTMYLNSIPNKLQGSLVLSLGYILGVIVLFIAKKIWINYFYN